MSSPLFARTNLDSNFGSRILINQQQVAHQKRLNQIYNKDIRHYSSTPSLVKKNVQTSKKEKYQNYQHHKNIQHLYNFIIRKKNIHDRLKDPHDFFAYPAYFFRQIKQQKRKPKQQKNKKKLGIKSQNVKKIKQAHQNNEKYGINVSKVKKHLPILEQFTEQQLQQYADSITRMIFNYNLNSPERIQYLKQCVLKSIQPHYPPEFPEVVQQIFEELSQSINQQGN